jgi:hypothetical protein
MEIIRAMQILLLVAATVIDLSESRLVQKKILRQFFFSNAAGQHECAVKKTIGEKYLCGGIFLFLAAIHWDASWEL